MNNKKLAKFSTPKKPPINSQLHKKTNIANPELAHQVLRATRKPTKKENYVGEFNNVGVYANRYGEYVGMSALRTYMPEHLQAFRTPYDKEMASRYAKMNTTSYGDYVVPDASIKLVNSSFKTVENYRGYIGAYAGYVPRKRRLRSKNAICVC